MPIDPNATLDVLEAQSVGSLAAILAKVSKAFAVDFTEIGSDFAAPGSVLLLLPLEVVGPELFALENLTGESEDRIASVFNARPAWVDLTIARVPRAEFDAARAAFRLGGRSAVFARWQVVSLI